MVYSPLSFHGSFTPTSNPKCYHMNNKILQEYYQSFELVRKNFFGNRIGH